MDETLVRELRGRFPEPLEHIKRIDCDNGWYLLVETLCCAIQDHCKRTKRQVRVLQIKEKLGGFRCYLDSVDERLDAFVEMAERLAWLTCERCGATEKIGRTEGHIKTLCQRCATEAGVLEQWQVLDSMNMLSQDGIRSIE